MDAGVLRTGSEGAVLVVTIDNPPTNLVGGPFIGALIALVDELDRDQLEVIVGPIELLKICTDT